MAFRDSFLEEELWVTWSDVWHRQGAGYRSHHHQWPGKGLCVPWSVWTTLDTTAGWSQGWTRMGREVEVWVGSSDLRALDHPAPMLTLAT